MGAFLTDAVDFPNCVPVAGSVDFHADDGQVWPLALLQAQVTHQGDGWTFAVADLARALEQRGDATERGGAMAERAQVLGQRLAELHVALARRTGNAAFDPEALRTEDLQRWSAEVRDACRDTLDPLWQRREAWPDALAALAARVAAAAPQLATRAAAVAQLAPAGMKTRHHGDLHLAQVLLCRDDFVFIDFEGEPQRSLEARRAKHSALRDVAGMLRSFDYARHTALHQATSTPAELPRLATEARHWERAVRDAFLASYRDAAVHGGLYPSAEAFAAATPLLELFELEKALYELRYELDNRPDWVAVPLAGIATLAGVEN
jgi:maltose alpha-D-glucosyltransferase/alpha-amylase